MTQKPDIKLKFADAEACLYRAARRLHEGGKEMLCDEMIVQHFTGNEDHVVIYERDNERRVGRIRLLMGLSSSSPAVSTAVKISEAVEEIDAEDEKSLLAIYDKLLKSL